MKLKFMRVAGLLLTLLSSFTLVSCLDGDESDNEYLIQGYFTVDASNSAQFILHQDGGGTVSPLMSSLQKPSEFAKNERYLLMLKYKQADVSQDGKSITGAQLYGGEAIDTRNPLTVQQATEKNVLASDSLFNVMSISSVWAYRGYINTLVKSRYAVKDNKGILPTFELVYDPDSINAHPGELKFRLCSNRHTTKTFDSNGTYQELDAGPYEFVNSFRLSQFSQLVSGGDSIVVSIEADGVEKPSKVKVARKDFIRGNY